MDCAAAPHSTSARASIATTSRGSSTPCSTRRRAATQRATPTAYRALWDDPSPGADAVARSRRSRLRRSGGSRRIRSRACARSRATCSCRRCRASASTGWCRGCSPSPPSTQPAGDAATPSSSGCSALLDAVSGRSAYLALLDRASAAAAAARATDGRVGVGGRLPDAPSDAARRAARRARAARRTRLARWRARARPRCSPRTAATPSGRWTRCATSSTRRRSGCSRRTWPAS